jgi:hypothetical protein
MSMDKPRKSAKPDIDPNTGKAWVRCLACDAPMLPPGVKKLPNEYDHAQGCPEPTVEKVFLPSHIRRGRVSTDPTWRVTRGGVRDPALRRTVYFGRRGVAEEFATHGCAMHQSDGFSCSYCRGRNRP